MNFQWDFMESGEDHDEEGGRHGEDHQGHGRHHGDSEENHGRDRGHRRGARFWNQLEGFVGGGLRAARMFASGDIQLIVLTLLNEKPRHGYEIIKALEEHSSGVYTPSPGVVYPALTYLEEMGYAEAQADGNKKLYTITPEGKEYLRKNQGLTSEMLEKLSRLGKKVEKMKRHFAEEEAENDYFDGDQKNDDRAEWRKLKMKFRELRDELKAALHEKMDESAEEKKRIMEILKRAIQEIRGK